MRVQKHLRLFASLILFPVLVACGDSTGGSSSVSKTTQIFRTYTFEGSISDIISDGGGVIASGGYGLGDNVSAKFAVDFTANPKITLNSGEVVIPADPQMTNDVHSYFYAKFISGTVIPELNGGINNASNNVKLYEVGYNESSPIGNSGVLEGGSDDSSFTIIKSSMGDASVQNWTLGEHFKGVFYSCSDNGCSTIWADIILTDIR